MTSTQAIQLIEAIPRDKVKSHDCWKLTNIEALVRCGSKPDDLEAKFLNDVYRYTNGGDDRQDQPFKQYRRKTSWGVK